MSEEENVESLRKDIGEKMGRDGEVLHENASASVKAGYRRGIFGFGSNTTPVNFGKGYEQRSDWTCLCDTLNRRYLNRCTVCNLSRNVAQEAS